MTPFEHQQAGGEATTAAGPGLAAVADAAPVQWRKKISLICGIVLLALLAGCAIAYIPEWIGIPGPQYGYDDIIDALSYSGIIILAIIIYKISSKEIRKTSSYTKSSEGTLEEERDSLEQRIAERTQSLVAAEKERIDALERTAQFGALSQGLFHDLMGPLSSISLHMEKLAAEDADSSREARDTIQKTVDISRRMRSFMDSVKSYTSNISVPQKENRVELTKELGIVRDILAYKARMAGVRMIFDCPETFSLKANPVRVQQLMLNLISNAIESYGTDGTGKGREYFEKTVNIRARAEAGNIIIKVEDNGHGISDGHIAKAGLKPFTTKEKGTGTGLMTIRSIVEKELGGNLKIESIQGKGTAFTISIPHSRSSK